MVNYNLNYAISTASEVTREILILSLESYFFESFIQNLSAHEPTLMQIKTD